MFYIKRYIPILTQCTRRAFLYLVNNHLTCFPTKKKSVAKCYGKNDPIDVKLTNLIWQFSTRNFDKGCRFLCKKNNHLCNTVYTSSLCHERTEHIPTSVIKTNGRSLSFSTSLPTPHSLGKLCCYLYCFALIQVLHIYSPTED